MWRLKTLRVQFALWTASLLLVAMLAFSSFIYLRTAQSLREELDDSLQVSATQAIAGIGGENLNVESGQLSLSDNLIETNAFNQLREQGLTIRVLSNDGSIRQAVGTYRDTPVDPISLQAIATREPIYSSQSVGTLGQVRIYTLPIQEHGSLVGMIQIIQSQEPIDETLRQLLAAFVIGIPLLMLVAGAGGYLLAVRALQPIDSITRTAQRISAADLHSRLNLPSTPDEVGRLAATFDAMLARLDGAFQRERQFTADASHELRTPLAAMDAILTVTRDKPRSMPEYHQALDDLAIQTRRLRGLVEDLLRLARGEDRQVANHESLNLSVLLADVIETLRPLAEERNLQLHTQITPDLHMIGDSDGLIRLFLNILDNALKYTNHGAITLLASKDTNQLTVTIRDTGIGIAPQHLPHLFERFYRVEEARTDRGTGLGLPIAQEIVQAHAGSIAITSIVGQGTTCTICLP